MLKTAFCGWTARGGTRHITKTLLVMKLTVFLITVACFHVTAEGISQNVTFSGKDVPIEKIFAVVKQQTGYLFFYQENTLKSAKPVTIVAKNKPLLQFLDEVFSHQPLKYVVGSKTITVSPSGQSGAVNSVASGNHSGSDPEADPVPIKVRITDSLGQPLSGATITIKNNKVTGVTDPEGIFSVNVVEGDVLLVSYVGYETRRITVIPAMLSSTNNLVISLRPSITRLENVEVVVNTGYQRIGKERFVGSFSQLDSAAYQKRAGMDILSRLDGMVAGVLFDKKAGPAILQLKTIQVRGLSTLPLSASSASIEPLIIVDNFPFKQSLSAINPNDVDNIVILRDAAATSIWGAQAGNGVIVITTKKGRYNQKFSVSFANNVSVQERPDQYYYPNMGVPDFVDLEINLFYKGHYNANLANTTNWPVISPVVELLAKRRAGIVSMEDSATQIDGYKALDMRRDLDKYVYRNTFSQQHYLNLSGGSDVFKYNLSGGYNRNLNNIQHSRADQQITLNTSAGVRLKNLEITSGIAYSQGMQKGATFSLPPLIYPYAQLMDAEGNAAALPMDRRMDYLDTAGGGQLLDWKYRPLDEVKLYDNQVTTKFIQLSLGIDYKLTSWLSTKFGYQYNDQGAWTNNYYDINTYMVRNLINRYTNLLQTTPQLRNPLPAGSMLDLGFVNNRSHNFRGQANINKTFAYDHSIIAMVAAEISEKKESGNYNRLYEYNRETNTDAKSIDYVTRYPTYANLYGNIAVPNESRRLSDVFNRTLSFLGNISYSYKNRYTLYGSARKDGSNLFGVKTNRRWKPLWSLGASWDMAKEKFYTIHWLESLRLRASFGYSGNPSNAVASPIIRYSPWNAPFTNYINAEIAGIPNPNLRWEKVRISNIAVDFSAFKGRVSGSIDVFSKRSTDIFAVDPRPPSTGASIFETNAANLKGHGCDIRLNTINTNGAVKWQTSFNFSTAKIMVTDIFFNSNKTADYTAYSLNAFRGKIVYGMSSFRWAGLDPQTGDPRGYLNKHVSSDYNALLNDSLQNQLFHGSSIPLQHGNIINSVSWKGFAFFANISYRLNFYYRKPTLNYTELVNSWRGHADYALRWQQPGDEQSTNVPSFIYPLNSERDRFYALTEVNVARGDNIRLSDLRLQYDFTIKKITHAVRSLQLSVAANQLNIILWKKDKSPYDPDYTGGDAFITPIPVMWTGSLNISF
jgi:TonB-linked SusC/RagA family outer membrane protein